MSKQTWVLEANLGEKEKIMFTGEQVLERARSRGGRRIYMFKRELGLEKGKIEVKILQHNGSESFNQSQRDRSLV